MKKLKKVISSIIIIISVILLLILYYVKTNINWTSFDQLLFSISNAEGTSTSVLTRGISYVGLYFLIFVFIIIIIKLVKDFVVKKYFSFSKSNFYLCITIYKFIIKIKIYPLNQLMLSIVFGVFVFLFIFGQLGIPEYIKYKKNKSTIFEEYYVNPQEKKVIFESEKRNLIYIYVESLETTGLSKESGGYREESITPKLESLAKENVNFSNTEKLGGFFVPSGAGWTIAAMVAQTSGIPLKTGATQGNEYSSDNFLSGAYSLGDILNDNGYTNYLMLGSDAAFGGRKNYFEQHGNYKIRDYKWAIKEKLIPSDYYEWWGFEDLKLFEYAKIELKKISNNKEPFNFTLLTADTHFSDGYMDSTCKSVFKNDKYSDSFYCSDEKIYNFIEWIKQQDFYKNTTIIVVGDHLTMQKKYYDDIDYNRTVYNVIINGIDLSNDKTNNRIYTSFDMYPTTLASIGATIPGDRLGFGTNLYSDKKTLTEELGLDYFNDEVSKESDYYNHKILKDDYINLYKEDK